MANPNSTSGARPGVTLVCDPNGIFFSGGCFSTLDLSYSARLGSWQDGILFEVKTASGDEFEAVVVGGVPVRLRDGWYLDVKGNGKYAWREGGYEWTNC